jgi:hypothetical protein
MMVQRDDPQRTRSFPKVRFHALELLGVESASLLAPGLDGDEPDDDELVRPVYGLDLTEDASPLVPRPGDATRNRVRDVVITRHREQWATQPAQEGGCPFELRSTTAMSEIAGHDDELGIELFGQLSQPNDRLWRLPSPQVKVGDMDNARGQGRGRLYTRTVANEAPEIFDDVYLGLRAGGAVRKQRRGEPLSVEEEDAIGRWKRLSFWRKSIAVGAFALGTFGLGLTIGGLIFGRWRKARA